MTLALETKTSHPNNNYRTIRYLLLVLGINSLLWGVVISYIKFAAKVYTTNWSIILPGAVQQANVNVGGGQASSNTTTAYDKGMIDPRANYETIITSREVIKDAADILDVDASEFKTLKVELVDPTATINFTIDGDTPTAAKRKAIALQQAFNIRLDMLRAQEINERDAATAKVLNTAKANLDRNQAALATFRASTGLFSVSQTAVLLDSLTKTKEELGNINANLAQQTQRYDTYSSNLKISPREVVSSFPLKSDSTFQKTLQDYGTVSTGLINAGATYLPSHPTIINLQEKKNTLAAAMTSRASMLVGRPVNEAEISALLATGSGGKETASSQSKLYEDLIVLQSDVRGLAAQRASLAAQVNNVSAELAKLSVNQPQLEALERNVRFSEVVYTSALGKIDLSKADIYAAYPLTQNLVAPSLGEESAPKKTLALLGGATASILFTTALGLLWLRAQGKKQLA